jgi:UDP-2-acetamido-3-amino-2,3-dideoxy-glucuronate N-acetyltransferase
MVCRAGLDHVDPVVQRGEGALVHQSAYVGDGAAIGPRCSLGQNVVVMHAAMIGKNAKIQKNLALCEGVQLEEDVFCGPSMVFTTVYNPHIAVSRNLEHRRTLVRRGASIGASAAIVCGIAIERYAFLGPGMMVTCDVPNHALIDGVPARQIGWMNEDGHRAEGPA